MNMPENYSDLFIEIKQYESSLSTLTNLQVGDKLYYDANTGAFSTSTTKSLVESFWGKGLLSSTIQQVSRTLSGEDYKTTVIAIDDFCEKLSITSKKIKVYLASLTFSDSREGAIYQFSERLNIELLNGGFENLLLTYTDQHEYATIFSAIIEFKKKLALTTSFLAEILKDRKISKGGEGLRLLELRIKLSKEYMEGKSNVACSPENEFTLLDRFKEK